MLEKLLNDSLSFLIFVWICIEVVDNLQGFSFVPLEAFLKLSC